MKLEKWLIMNTPLNEENGERERSLTKAENLHVIGTCGECEHWVQEDNVGWGSCGNSQKDGELGTVGHTFGCIHFEQKEVADEIPK